MTWKSVGRRSVSEDKPRREPDEVRPPFPEGTEPPSRIEPRQIFQSVSQHTTNMVVNFNEGLSFPPPEQIHALEQHAPGFVSAVMQEWHTEMAHRRELENKYLDSEFAARQRTIEAKHEYNMLELRLDDDRIRGFAIVIAVLMALLGVSGVVLLFLDNVTAGTVCLGAYSLAHIPAVIESLRGRKKK
jgi:uncharacterized membrane protein